MFYAILIFLLTVSCPYITVATTFLPFLNFFKDFFLTLKVAVPFLLVFAVATFLFFIF